MAPPLFSAPAGLAPTLNSWSAIFGAKQYQFPTGTFRLGQPPENGVEKLLGYPCPVEVKTDVALSTVLAKITCCSVSSSEQNSWSSIIIFKYNYKKSPILRN